MVSRLCFFASSLILSCALVVSVAASPAGDHLPLRFLQLKSSDEGSRGNLLVAQRLATEERPSATVALVETPEGHRGESTFVFDPESGTATYRFVDLSSGWWSELEHDLGFSNLGTVEEHGDSSDWSVNIQRRAEQERAPSTYTLRTSDGLSVAWVVPWREPRVAERAKKDALATFATKLAEVALPPSVAKEIATLAAFLRSDAERHLSSTEPLVEALSLALRAAGVLPAIPEAGVESTALVSLPETERPEAAKRLLARLE